VYFSVGIYVCSLSSLVGRTDRVRSQAPRQAELPASYPAVLFSWCRLRCDRPCDRSGPQRSWFDDQASGLSG